MLTRLHLATRRILLVLEQIFNLGFTNAYNPMYHLGPLIFFFFWVVLVSGIYIFIFFETNVANAFNSVEYMTHDQWWLAGIMRSLHRYASDAAVLTIFLHMIREFSRDRYRSVRWFSWLTGVPTLWLVVLLGISGYWLVWDMLAQYIALATAEMVDWLPVAPGSMVFNFLEGAMTDRFFTLMAFLHLLLFPVGIVFMLWTHVSRISKVNVMPPRGLAIGTLIALIGLSIVKPAISHGPADLTMSPITLNLDWFYLNIYPFMDKMGPFWAWVLPIIVTVFLMALPWIPKKADDPVALIDLDYCDGCEQCARDCPFGAITMQPRTDGRNYQFEPQLDPGICTACGICVASCHYSNPYRQKKETIKTGCDMPQMSMEEMRVKTRELAQGLTGESKVLIFGCQRAASLELFDKPNVAHFSMLCSGMLPPSMIDFALKNGADGVMVTGCRDHDCYFRLGNTLTDMRVRGDREPHLFDRTDKKRVDTFRATNADRPALTKRLADFQAQIKDAQAAEAQS